MTYHRLYVGAKTKAFKQCFDAFSGENVMAAESQKTQAI